MLKIAGLSDKPAPSRNNSSRLAFKKNNGNGEIDEFDGDSVEHAKKSGKSKDQNLAKSQKLSQSEKSQGEKPKKVSKK